MQNVAFPLLRLLESRWYAIYNGIGFKMRYKEVNEKSFYRFICSCMSFHRCEDLNFFRRTCHYHFYYTIQSGTIFLASFWKYFDVRSWQFKLFWANIDYYKIKFDEFVKYFKEMRRKISLPTREMFARRFNVAHTSCTIRVILFFRLRRHIVDGKFQYA